MKLYLSSYKLGNQTDYLSNWLQNNSNEIMVIANALDCFPDGERKQKGIEEKASEIEALGFKTSILDLRNYFGNKERLYEDLKDKRAFYVLGGNVFVLRTAMKLSGFDGYLREISDKDDYLYSGFSAGICVLAKNLKGIHLVDEPDQDPYNYGKTIWEGIGIINYMPVPHYDTPEHPESEMMYKVVAYLEENELPYKTMKDGEVIIEKIVKSKEL